MSDTIKAVFGRLPPGLQQKVRDFFLHLPQKYPLGHTVLAIIDLTAERALAGLGPACKVVVRKSEKQDYPRDPLGRFPDSLIVRAEIVELIEL